MIPGLALSGIASFVRRAWPHLVIVALVWGALAYAKHIGFQRGAESRQPEIAALEKTIADVRVKTAAAHASDLANKARVEAEQSKVQANDETKLRRDLADARAAVERLRRSPQTDTSGSGEAGMSSIASASNAADGSGGDTIVSIADAVICADNSVKAKGWQDWWKQVSMIDRGGE